MGVSERRREGGRRREGRMDGKVVAVLAEAGAVREGWRPKTHILAFSQSFLGRTILRCGVGSIRFQALLSGKGQG